MSNLNTCSNEKLSFKYSDEWELEEVPLENNPDCIATLSYEDGSLLNVIAFQSEMPSLVDFKEIIEPLRNLFKDEVRSLGLHLGIPEKLVMRQPFPGPGLGIRIVGEVTAEKVRMVQEADSIFRQEMDSAGLSRTAGQYFAALTNMRSVGRAPCSQHGRFHDGRRS